MLAGRRRGKEWEGEGVKNGRSGGHEEKEEKEEATRIFREVWEKCKSMRDIWR